MARGPARVTDMAAKSSKVGALSVLRSLVDLIVGPQTGPDRSHKRFWGVSGPRTNAGRG